MCVPMCPVLDATTHLDTWKHLSANQNLKRFLLAGFLFRDYLLCVTERGHMGKGHLTQAFWDRDCGAIPGDIAHTCLDAALPRERLGGLIHKNVDLKKLE